MGGPWATLQRHKVGDTQGSQTGRGTLHGAGHQASHPDSTWDLKPAQGTEQAGGSASSAGGSEFPRGAGKQGAGGRRLRTAWLTAGPLGMLVTTGWVSSGQHGMSLMRIQVFPGKGQWECPPITVPSGWLHEPERREAFSNLRPGSGARAGVGPSLSCHLPVLVWVPIVPCEVLGWAILDLPLLSSHE